MKILPVETKLFYAKELTEVRRGTMKLKVAFL